MANDPTIDAVKGCASPDLEGVRRRPDAGSRTASSFRSGTRSSYSTARRERPGLLPNQPLQQTNDMSFAHIIRS